MGGLGEGSGFLVVLSSCPVLQEASCKNHRVNRVVFLGSTKRLLTTGVSRWNTRQIALWDQVGGWDSLSGYHSKRWPQNAHTGGLGEPCPFQTSLGTPCSVALGGSQGISNLQHQVGR